MLITLEDARAQLPKLGEVRMECPTINETTCTRGSWSENQPQRCVVVDVRPEQLWYTVQFENGFPGELQGPETEIWR